MAQWYDLLATSDTIQVLSPTLTLPSVVCTLRSKPTGMIFQYAVAKATWDAGDAPPLLELVAEHAEHLISATPAFEGTGGDRLDANGMREFYIAYTVGDSVPGFPPNTLTAEVDIPVGDLDQDTIAGENVGLDDAIAKIQTAYDLLVAGAAG